MKERPRRDLTTLALWLRVLHRRAPHRKRKNVFVSLLQMHPSIHLMMVFSSIQRMMDNVSVVLLNFAGSLALEKCIVAKSFFFFFYQLNPY